MLDFGRRRGRSPERVDYEPLSPGGGNILNRLGKTILVCASAYSSVTVMAEIRSSSVC